MYVNVPTVSQTLVFGQLFGFLLDAECSYSAKIGKSCFSEFLCAIHVASYHNSILDVAESEAVEFGKC